MSPKYLAVAISVAIPFLVAGEALARRVTHVVTAASIDKLPFKASVKVKDVEKLKEVEITISGIVGDVKGRPSGAPGGWVSVGTDKPLAVKPTTAEGTTTFTFQIEPDQFGKARFSVVEDAEDWRREFPTRGDLYQFELKAFTSKK